MSIQFGDRRIAGDSNRIKTTKSLLYLKPSTKAWNFKRARRAVKNPPSLGRSRKERDDARAGG
jgi:hypothetical protein